jgi:CDP-glucose 4,6-dehydratase
MRESFGGFYRGKTALVTGHTGFKGSWLSIWLKHLGATVVGYALEPPTDPCNFRACHLEKRICHIYGDVRDYALLEETFQMYRPDLVFHLAAQPLVRRSFREPRLTFEVNVMGTVNVLEAARRTNSVQALVAITSDKCYRNVGWGWGYRETDALGGDDAYGASKACAELAIAAYQNRGFQQAADPQSNLPIASTRAGNVIGGGDWAQDRIVPDIVKAIAAKTNVVIRNPDATRPWEHVLEPLSGYLWLGALLAQDREQYCSAWNFGPGDSNVFTVAELARSFLKKWSAPATQLVVNRDEPGAEALLLWVDCHKANHHLKWRSTWTIDRTLSATVAWYKQFYHDMSQDMFPYAIQQIEEYTQAARAQEIAWAQS